MTITWHAHEPPPASSFPWLTWWQACGGGVSTQDLWPGPMQVWGCCCGPCISWLVLTKSQEVLVVVCDGGLRTPTAGCSLHTSKWRHFPQSQYGDIYTHNMGISISLEWRDLLIYQYITEMNFIRRSLDHYCYILLHIAFKCDIDVWIISQTMMKLNPMKSPRTPPQSATRDPIEYASSSFSVRMDGLSNLMKSWVVFGRVICSGLPTIWQS